MYCTVKQRLAIFPSPAGMSQTKLSLAGNNQINHKTFLTVQYIIQRQKI